MNIKAIEIRDAGTFIPVVAFQLKPENAAEHYLIRSAGFGIDQPAVVVYRLNEGKSNFEPDMWGMTRTMRVAHEWIAANWDSIVSGDVVDVQYLIGERETPKVSQRF